MLNLFKEIIKKLVFSRLNFSLISLKENLPLIIIIPTALGGIWQILELSSLGVSYIRFFSTAQLLPDGLIVIFIISGLLLYMSNAIDLYENKSFEHHYNYSYKELFLLFIFNTLILLALSKIISQDYFKNVGFTLMVTKLTLCYIIFRCFIYIAEIITTIILKSTHKDPKIIDNILIDIKKQDYSKKYVKTATFLILIIMAFISYYIISSFRQLAYYPDNFENLTRIENQLIKNFKLCTPPELSYFNKDYLFYKIRIDDKSRIYIIEAKNLFLSPLEADIKKTNNE